MLPLEVRIVPTYAVIANVMSPYQAILDVTGLSWLIEKVSGVQVSLSLGLLNSYTGLIMLAAGPLKVDWNWSTIAVVKVSKRMKT